LPADWLPHLRVNLPASNFGGADDACWLGWLAFLSPAVAKHLSVPLEILGIVAEGLLMLWLVVKGVNVERWRVQASGKL